MKSALLVQLPVPQINFGLKTGNIPLGAACLCQAASGLKDWQISILPERIASRGSDAALIRHIADQAPDIVGFTVFCWNLDRSLYLAQKIKERIKTRIIFGGPEITPDNTRIQSRAVDFYVYGEGEAVFIELLTSDAIWEKGCGSGTGLKFPCPLSLGSPYLKGYLSFGEENLMLLETQRGCPYRCGFCYYNKSRKKRSIAEDRLVLDGISWAIENRIEEIYLLDPSLNTRPGLADLLKKIEDINKKGRPLSLISEIRAESIDRRMADLFKKAGFTEFEVGLQTATPKAQKLMRRPTDMDAFLRGVKELQQVGITPKIDLIFGLPGDTLEDFKKTLAFVKNNQMDELVQVFPLLILPGTDFRKNSRNLGLLYEPAPPYTVIKTPDFSSDQMIQALDMAETQFDVSLYLFPDLEVSFKSSHSGDIMVPVEEGIQYISKLIVHNRRNIESIISSAHRLTAPYQVFFGPGMTDDRFIHDVLRCLCERNPFVPMEVIFLEPRTIPDIDALLGSIPIHRPHFLDISQRYLYLEPGNRAVQFTLVTKNENLIFEGDMKRQIFLWDRPGLPEESDFQALVHLDGILIDSPVSEQTLHSWQDQMADHHADLPMINFSAIALQIRWMTLTEGDEYAFSLLQEQTI